ncbi:clathrin adaptor, mu subunit [Piedraia hortae CBS 480.64]|uniref:Clathrin adaptor, mu subunit n=1 Tax=Piedraia hortae CBS 480.64 TaxID=1314780 RepID=A0A6A7BVL3_9PEZI|nr:clathrin adaptor, mu subunit [Piedraia hortae CBS 480.64]
MSTIEAVYIYEHDTPILEHIYTSRPPSAATLLTHYLSHPTPRPSVLNLPTLGTVIFTCVEHNLLFLTPSSRDIDPLLALTFLHRVSDSLIEFLGSPLLGSTITTHTHLVSQILSSLSDSGLPSETEPNALRDVVHTGPGALDNLLGKVGIAPQPAAQQQQQQAQQPAIPWRRANVRHTSNELYVDIVESLRVTLAPSGRPLAAFAEGSIAFTSKVSGVPDLVLSLTAGGGREGLKRLLQRVVFHPCVRLSRWEKEGVLSFVPPDGRFALCGYEVDLLGGCGITEGRLPRDMPLVVEVDTAMGGGDEFEVRLRSSKMRSAAESLSSNLEGRSPAEGVVVRVPLQGDRVRNVVDLRASRGEAVWMPGEEVVEWKVPSGTAAATLRCRVQAAERRSRAVTTTYDYQDGGEEVTDEDRDLADLMPRSATLSFSVKGWLASGVKVDSLVVGSKSRGIGAEVRPYKGVKYLTVSREGVEVRC